MAYTIPPPHNATYAASDGRSDDVHDEIGSRIEEPKFVDNSIHHALYETSSVGDISLRDIKIKKPQSSHFLMSHQRKYRFAEEESMLRLSHMGKTDTPYYDGALMNTTSTVPPLLLDSDNTSLRLKADSIINTDKGVGLILSNMKGKTLIDFKMENTKSFHLSHMINVGLRTSDLVQKLFKNSLHSLNSVSVGLPLSPKTAVNETLSQRHSKTFLAKDFYSSSIPAAVRAVARHDHYSLFHDRFGNFIYAPKMFKVINREIGQKRGAGSVQTDPITEAANRIVVRGKAQALNDSVRVMIDDIESQKKEGVIRQMRVDDMTSTNILQARRTGNQLLRLNRKAQGAIRSGQHARSWDLEPGEVVDFKSPSVGIITKKAIIELTHSSNGESDFQLASYESGLEGVINAFANDMDAKEEEHETDRTHQIVKLEMTGLGRAQFNTIGAIITRGVNNNIVRITADATITHANLSPNTHAGFIVGHRHADMTGASRSAIGSGHSKRISGTYGAGTITVADTTGFPAATVADPQYLTLTYISGATYSVATVSYTALAATTFTGVSIVAPSGGTIPATISEIKLLRPRGHEMRTVKTLKKTRRL
ncbi:MAG: hypothetical protein HOC79_05415 [Euryarchaeota archaeon]|jgi:hypothetical protein|nr:hypothetical protein [Euryarchaeota archaeon]